MNHVNFAFSQKLFFTKLDILRHTFLIMLVLFAISAIAKADTAIETETAQIGKKGDIAFSQSYEYGHAKDGTSGGTLTQFEYGLSDNAELLVEPFFYAWDNPKGESKVDGLGDLEITPSYEFIHEDGLTPAVLAAFKLKVPMGSEKAGSSGEFDYLPYFIFGQHFGGWIFNANLGMNFVAPSDKGDEGERKGFGHTTTWCLEGEHSISKNLTLFLEAFSTEDKVVTYSSALEYELTEHINTFVAAGYTQNDESIFRIGFNLEFGSDTAK